MHINRPAKLILVSFVTLLAIGLHLFLFLMRYGWYVQNEEAVVLKVVYGLFLGAALILFSAWPRSWALAIIGFAAMVTPPMISPASFVAVDLAFIPFIALSVCALVAAGLLRAKVLP